MTLSNFIVVSLASLAYKYKFLFDFEFEGIPYYFQYKHGCKWLFIDNGISFNHLRNQEYRMSSNFSQRNVR